LLKFIFNINTLKKLNLFLKKQNYSTKKQTVPWIFRLWIPLRGMPYGHLERHDERACELFGPIHGKQELRRRERGLFCLSFLWALISSTPDSPKSKTFCYHVRLKASVSLSHVSRRFDILYSLYYIICPFIAGK
jgi:hypothetical protein